MRHRNAPARAAPALLTILALVGCTSTLVSSWTAPDATPFPLTGEKLAAVVMVSSESMRRAGEDALARQLTRHGAQGIAMYTIVPDAETDEAEARRVAERAGIVGVVVMRPVSIDKQITATPHSYSGPMYGGFWGGYYGLGWGSPWGPGEISANAIRTDTVVIVETLVYGLRENKLLWAGQSRTMNPQDVDRLIRSTADQVVNELARLGLVAKR